MTMTRTKQLLAAGALLAVSGIAILALQTPDRQLRMELWNGAQQRVGHLGDAQPDFNVVGIAGGNRAFVRVNDGPPTPLTLGEGEFGFRRLGAQGHFNADVPIADLRPGENAIEVVAENSAGQISAHLTLTYEPGWTCSLPFTADWTKVEAAQDAGQIVDGKWELTEAGLRSRQPLYDRLFLIGNKEWQDYDVRTSMTVHEVAEKTGPKSGAPGVGFIFRFAGHVVDPPRFPEAQPKWGFQPFGAMLWLRWSNGGAAAAPVRQFYRGDRNESEDFAALTGFTTDTSYELRASCVTDSADSSTTVYRLRVWPFGTPEPETWDFEVTQESEDARRSGGVALVAHHVDVTFGNVTVEAR